MIGSLGAGACAHVASDGAHVQVPATQSKIVLIPNAVDFNNVVLGQKNSQTVKISNEGTKTSQIKSVRITGAGFSVTGITSPFSLEPQASETFNIEFAPKSVGPIDGALTIESSIAGSETFVVKGTGTKTLPKLQTNPVSVNFGNMVVKRTAAQKVMISNTGNAKVTVSQVVLSGRGFSVSELPSHFELAPQQETSFLVSFLPQVKGPVNGTLTFVSKDLNVPLTVTLTGDGVEGNPVPTGSDHIVTLTWVASVGSIRGYNVYRGQIDSGGTYLKLTASPINTLEYRDTDVASGQEYFYFVTAVNHGGHESSHSEQISVTIPTP